MDIESYRDVIEALHRFVTDGEPEGPKVRKRMRILAAAAELFERHGYRRTAIAEVARQAAVAKGTVYLYYPSKAHLLLHVIMHERAQLYERMEPVLAADLPPRERLRRFLQQAVVLAETMPIANRVKAGEPELVAALSELDLEVTWPSIELFDAIFAWLIRSAVDEPLGPRELHDRGHVLIAVLQGLPVIAHPRLLGDLSREAFGHLLADMLVDGVTAPPRYTEDPP